MKSILLLLAGMLSGLAIAMVPAIADHLRLARQAIGRESAVTGEARAHTREKFVFTANASAPRVAPLFGANQEREWSPHWDPRFIYPQPASDEAGMVFTVAHHHLNSVWVNTEYDLPNGRFQYVYVVPDLLLTVITVRLEPQGERTAVAVEYDRTALSPAADAHVRELASQDRASGPEWEKQINDFLGRRSGS